jgi:hypothetical protein
LRGRGVIGRIGLRQNLDVRIGLEHGLCAFAPIVADRDTGGSIQDENVALAVELLDEPFRRELAPLALIGVDLRGQVIGVDEAIEIGDRDSLRAGVGDDAIERSRRSGVDDDRIELGVDHRLDLLDLCVGVALGVGDRQAIDQTLLFQHVCHILDRAGRLLHPRRDRIDVGPAYLEGRPCAHP